MLGNTNVHSVKYNFIMNTILKMSSFIFPLISFPYVSHVLGADGNGKIAFASSFVAYFSMLSQLGIPTYGIRTCARHRGDKMRLSRTVHELLIINSVMTILSYVVMIVMITMVPKLQQNINILLVSSVSIVLTTVGMEWLYQAIEQYGYITYRNLSFKVLSVALMFLFVKQKEDYIIYAGINVVGTVGSNLMNLFRVQRYIYTRPFKKYNVRVHLRPILTFLYSRLQL